MRKAINNYLARGLGLPLDYLLEVKGMAVDFAKEVDTLSEGDRATELNELRAKDGPYWDERHLDHNKYVERVSQLYTISHKEPEGRDPNDTLSDTLRKEGFKTGEEIQAMGDEARQAIEDQQDIEDTDRALSTLRAEWGSDTERNINLAKA